jgi:hypothetical protein
MDIVKDESTQDVNITEETIKQEPAQYDPRKKYTWDKDAQFVLSGAEFGLILNTLRSIISTEEATKILMADKACQAIEQVMATSVAKGTIKEIPSQQ